MSVIKSISVGNGDMFFIDHNSDNFTMIDSCMSEDNREAIVDELLKLSAKVNVTRFISTHPDEDHLHGLAYLNSRMNLLNFYCIQNKTTKQEPSDDFLEYCSLRDSDRAFYLHEGCTRKWMNKEGDGRGSAGLSVLWPKTNNQDYKDALAVAEDGGSPNNTSIILKYSLNGGVTAMWMGDLETEFMEKILDDVELGKVNILFAPHHGRKSGRVPQEWLEAMDPDIIVIGEAPSENIDYASYDNYNTICQNSAGDIMFECVEGKVRVYVSNADYEVDFLDNETGNAFEHCLGTLQV